MPTSSPPAQAAVFDAVVFEAVVFDLDGVLIDSEHLWAELWERYATSHGVRWEARHTRDVQGMSSPEWSAYLTELVGAGHDPAEAEHTVVTGMIEAIRIGRAPLVPGADRMLAEVSAQTRVGLATSAPRRVIEAVLAAYDLGDCFTGTVSSAEVRRGKPSPDVYLEAATRVGARPGRCLAVEDSTNGVRAAAAAGMTVIAVTNRDYPLRAEAIPMAYKITSNLRQVREILREQLGLTGKESA